MKPVKAIILCLMMNVAIVAITFGVRASEQSDTALFMSIAQTQKDLRRMTDDLEKMDMQWECKIRVHDNLEDATHAFQDAQASLTRKRK